MRPTARLEARIRRGLQSAYFASIAVAGRLWFSRWPHLFGHQPDTKKPPRIWRPEADCSALIWYENLVAGPRNKLNSLFMG
jgi:hypothetical protein